MDRNAYLEPEDIERSRWERPTRARSVLAWIDWLSIWLKQDDDEQESFLLERVRKLRQGRTYNEVAEFLRKSQIWFDGGHPASYLRQVWALLDLEEEALI